jgi:hypothetical protein
MSRQSESPSGPFNRKLFPYSVGILTITLQYSALVLLLNGENSVRGFFAQKFSGSNMGILNF